jgi:hypothetical protein
MNATALRRRAAAAAWGLACCAAMAEPGFFAGAYSTGSFIPTDPTAAVNTGYGTLSTLSDGSIISHMGCIAATPGGVGCSVGGLPNVVDTWYKRATLPTLAAGQALADYGLLKARSWRTPDPDGDSAPGEPLGHRSFYAEATAEWREDLIYTSPTPTWVTLQFSLHARWEQLGRFALTLGHETFGAENVRLIEGNAYINCAGAIECQDGGLTHTVQVLGNDAANTSGEVNLSINFGFLLSVPPQDPENPSPIPPYTFVANLKTWSTAPGAETDAFGTVTLERILIEPGAQIGFASGHDWPVQVVPEPGTLWLWLGGLVALPLWQRLRARQPG